MRVAAQHLLHPQCQSVHALSHVGPADRQPYPHPGRNRDHRRARRATSATTAPGSRVSATIACFCSSVQRRRRSGPVITSTLAIAPPLTPVQAPSLALMLDYQPETVLRRKAALTGGKLRIERGVDASCLREGSPSWTSPRPATPTPAA